MTEKEFEKKLEKVDAACEKLVVKLAAEVRRTVVVPLCRKRKLRFTSGMGGFVFSHRGEHIYEDDAEQFGWPDLVLAFQILNAEVALHNHLFGMYVDDVS